MPPIKFTPVGRGDFEMARRSPGNVQVFGPDDYHNKSVPIPASDPTVSGVLDSLTDAKFDARKSKVQVGDKKAKPDTEVADGDQIFVSG